MDSKSFSLDEPKDSEILDSATVNQEDRELEEILSRKKARIKVIGCGGAGNNTITRISEIGIIGAETIAMNTDAQQLLYTNADKKILLGRELTGGLGTGANPQLGKEAAQESEHEIRDALKDAHMVFITAGMGGGTGTGGAPIVAETAKKMGILTVAVVTMPFTMEGQRRYNNALFGLDGLDGTVDTLIVIPNDKLLELAPDLPLSTAFKVADEILTNAVKGIAELITKPGLINLDFADVRAVMRDGGVAMIGVGESDTENRAVEATEKAIKNPLLDVEVAGAKGALINVAGGPDMSLEEARKAVEMISNKLDIDANVIWGAQIVPDLKNAIRVLIVITGVTSPQIFGGKSSFATKRKESLGADLGIDFVDQ